MARVHRVHRPANSAVPARLASRQTANWQIHQLHGCSVGRYAYSDDVLQDVSQPAVCTVLARSF